MLTKYRVEKRLPFGFMGQWGRVFKPFDYDMVDVDNERIMYDSREYVEIGMDVQFKRIDDDRIKAKVDPDATGKNNTILVETTARFDDFIISRSIINLKYFVKLFARLV